MWAVLTFTICCGILAIGDWLAVKTKALLSMMFVGGFIFLVGFTWLGFPSDLISASGANEIYNLTIGLVMVNMGASIPLDEMKRQWRTVITGFCAAALMGVIICGLGALVIDRNMAFVGAPVVAGGIGAMQAVLAGIDPQDTMYNTYSIFCTVIIMLQYLIGIPIASVICKKEARRVMKTGEIEKFRVSQDEGTEGRKKLFPPLPKRLQTPQIILLKGCLVTSLGYFINSILGSWGPTMLVCLLLGLLFQELGFLEKGFLGKANADGFVILAMTIAIFGSMAGATQEMIFSLAVPLIVVFVLGIMAVILNGFIMNKIFKTGFGMCTAIGLSGLFGFPPTMTISKEVAAEVAQNDEDQAALENFLMPQMVVGGFAVFTIGSVVVGSVIGALI
ncbi:MAG TPA: hypothetical protein H9798_00255 [Candidatus Mediterraneibacter pullicola]|uniref:Na+/glutamate symporter n=1 Tax=Candidatus Mediterraneibacter pullicola TaxID=2838682 RepID=A0A9D2H6Q6_9FIRM|nr:hypothetical protein [Candidatus Mediterraneibacter pullicola]